MKTVLLFVLFVVFGVTDASFAIARPQEMPQVKKKVEPHYPDIFLKAGIEGEVMIKALIDEQGKVEKAESVKASKPEFAEASLTAIKQWEFIPATKDGKPIKAEVFVPFNYRLGDKSSKKQSELSLKLQDEVMKIIKGDISEKLKNLIDPETYAVAGGRYESLYSLLFDKPKNSPLVEGPKYKADFSHWETGVDDAAVLVLKSALGNAKRDRFDTVVWMKTSEGVWKIRSWHMSK